MKPKIIAFYLPQFYPFKENDEWWGKGFTEWTNVGKAKSLFKGHYQPRVPSDLGYYDLRLPIVREQQVELAKEAGISAFCYWHYWFGKGKRLLENVFDEVLESGKPDFPFCLGWANHSWAAKNWNSDGTSENKTLIEQTYPGVEDVCEHFKFLLKAFKDKRYLKIAGDPFFFIFNPYELPDKYIELFKKMTKDAGFNDLYLVANHFRPWIDKKTLINRGFNAITNQRLGGDSYNTIFSSTKIGRAIYKKLLIIKSITSKRPPFLTNYASYYHNFIQEEEKENFVIPQLIPQFDHTPRSGWNGRLFINATPDYFYKHCLEALNAIKDKPYDNQILLLKSWNEWGEGNYMEPDLKYGKGFIKALRKAIEYYE